MDIQYWIKYAALAVAVHQSIVAVDSSACRGAWLVGSRDVKPVSPRHLCCYICSIAWALYFAL